MPRLSSARAVGVGNGDPAGEWLRRHDPGYATTRYGEKQADVIRARGDWLDKLTDIALLPGMELGVDLIFGDDLACVYFMQAGPGGPVKIGRCRTRSLKPRFDAVQIGNAAELRLTRLVEGPQQVEANLHRHFRALRLRGEWFELDDELRRVAHAQ